MEDGRSEVQQKQNFRRNTNKPNQSIKSINQNDVIVKIE